MSAWAGREAEIDGVRKAVRNLLGNYRQLAHYVYERASAYMGPDHEKMVVALFEAALCRQHEISVDRALQLNGYITEAERKHERDWRSVTHEIEAVLESIPHQYRVRVCEGGGPEDILPSLAVSVAKLVDAIRHGGEPSPPERANG